MGFHVDAQKPHVRTAGGVRRRLGTGPDDLMLRRSMRVGGGLHLSDRARVHPIGHLKDSGRWVPLSKRRRDDRHAHDRHAMVVREPMQQPSGADREVFPG